MYLSIVGVKGSLDTIISPSDTRSPLIVHLDPNTGTLQKHTIMRPAASHHSLSNAVPHDPDNPNPTIFDNVYKSK